MSDEPYLIISDLQIPYEHEKAFAFCRYLKRHYKIPDDHILNVGDETDQYFGSLYKKAINSKHTADQEIDVSIEKLKEWYSEFPIMKLAISNHGTRWMKKAFESDLPSRMLIDYTKVIQAPPGWRYAKRWVMDTKHPFAIEHGDDYDGPMPHLVAAKANHISIAIGHHHTKSGIEYANTKAGQRWGMVTGCLIDFDAFAFDYARKHLLKPVLTAGLVFNQGSTPMLVPMGA